MKPLTEIINSLPGYRAQPMSACQRKDRFGGREQAERAIRNMTRASHKASAYRCPRCRFWHITGGGPS